MKKRGNGEGSIYRTADGRWAAALSVGYEGGRRKRRVFTGRSRKDVARKLDDAKRLRDDGLSVASPRLTVASFLRRWLDESAKPRLRPRTFQSYEHIVQRHLVPVIGRYPLTALTPDRINSYFVTKRAEKLSARTIQYHHAVLRSALEQATRWGLVPRNAAKLVTPPRVVRDEVRPMTVEQTRDFLGAAEGHELGAAFAIAAGLGLRQSELLGLRWTSIDLDEGLLTVDASLQKYDGEYHLDGVKSHRSRRTLTVPEPLVAVLRRHHAAQSAARLKAGPLWKGNEWDLVFTNEFGEPLGARTLVRVFKSLLSEAGLPTHHRFHDLRHGTASAALTLGVPLKVVQDLLGHSTIAITADTYSHLTRELQRDATDRIGAGLWGPDSSSVAASG